MQGLPKPGDILNDTYEVHSLLGKGGFGAVYLARQINMDRDVAVKVLIAGGAKFEEMVKRFRREVMSIRNLTHPNTIRVYDFRDDPDGLLYYTMEALKGQNLKEVVGVHGPLSPRRAKHILRQICKSLSEAHSYGIVHRDLKPANIMLVDMHGETDFVKVLDFGIAKVVDDTNDEQEEQLTSAGILVGTLRYMAPEQITGEAIGPSTDLYALGLIAVEMLTGDSVFAGSGRWEVLHQQVSEDRIRIPDVVRTSPLGPILDRVLRKRVKDRFATAADLIEALDQIPDSVLSTQPLISSEGRELSAATSGVSSASSQRSSPLASPKGAFEAMKTEISTPRSLRPPQTDLASDDFAEVATAMIPSHLLKAPAPEGDETASVTIPGPLHGQGFDSPGMEGAKPRAWETDSALFVPVKKKGSPLVVGALALVVVVAVLAIVFALMSSSSSEEDLLGENISENSSPELGQVALVEAAEQGGEEAEEGEAQENAEPHWVRLQTDSVRANVFRDDERIGRTPMQVPVRSATEVRLEAEGFEPFIVLLDDTTEAELNVTLTRLEEVAPAAAAEKTSPLQARPPSTEQPSTQRSTTRTAPKTGGSNPGWIDIAPPTTKKRAPKTPPADDGWVDIVAPTKKTEKNETIEIPVF